MIDSLFFQLDQQQEIMDRYGDMEVALSPQIFIQHYLEENSRENRIFAFPYVHFFLVKYDHCARDLMISLIGRCCFVKSFQTTSQSSRSGLRHYTLKDNFETPSERAMSRKRNSTARSPGLRIRWMRPKSFGG